ncbi:CCA tRNA nucleotidyltransferase [Candidatus Woesearchaeota archaeon]|jgi:tRNA nucleotidyltransferase (CCA-adding enzyme)|nr:CCA tRNA nucleotidyltransferase [Candidatus Woesearchaeota archaeon]
MSEITNKVLEKIKPTKKEQQKFSKIISTFLNKLNSKLKPLQAQAILGGSGAKDTWLSGNHDIDIFVQFNYSKHKNNSAGLSDLLDPIIKKLFPKRKRIHGSRDYFQIKYQTIEFEIVPILKISNAQQALNITDVSPLHSKWVKKNASKITDEIRLVKQFCKANKLYGAESYITGFSGYILEILTTHYGSFKTLLQKSLHWENRDIFDLEKHYKNKIQALHNINRSKLNSPLIIVDPVDKNRNAAAAMSLEKFLLFKEKAREYLKKPSLKSFEKETITFKKLEQNTKHNLIYLEVSPKKGKEDVVGTKFLKAFLFLKKQLKDFELSEADWDWNKKGKAIFYFITEKRRIEPFFIRSGPPLKMEEFVKDFKKKNKETFEQTGRVMAKVPRKHVELEKHVKEILKDSYVKERIKEIKVLKFG